MNTFKSIKYLSVAVLLSAWGCSSTKQLTTKGEYDDTYGSSKDAPQVAYTPRQTPEYVENQRYQPEEPQQSQETATGTDEYYDENYLNSRKVYRNNNGDAGYDSGFANGYQSGWNDYAWSQPVGWSSPFNRFGNTWGNGFGTGFGLGLGFGGFNRFYDPFWGGYNSWGWGNRFYDPFWGSYGFNRFYDPFWGGYNSWGWGGFNSWNSWYSPYGFNSYAFYDRGFGNNIFVNNYYGNVTSGVNGVSSGRIRTYGPRDGGSGSGTYNRGFTNAAVNNGGGNTPDGRRSTNYGSRTSNGSEYARPSRNGEWNGSSASREYSRGTSRSYGEGTNSSSNDTYYARPRRNGGTEGGSYSNSNSSNNGGYNYSRPSTSSRSSDSWSSGSGNSSSRGSSSSSNNWSRGSSSSDSWSRGSSSSSSSSWGGGSSSSGGGSSSSSGGGGGGGGSSRGPR